MPWMLFFRSQSVQVLISIPRELYDRNAKVCISSSASKWSPPDMIIGRGFDPLQVSIVVSCYSSVNCH